MDTITVPIVSLRNIERVRRLFTYSEDEENLHLNYAEPLVNTVGKYIWRIEYRVDRNSKYHDNTELKRLLHRVKHKIGNFECVNIYFNLLDRIYLYVPPQVSSDRSVPDTKAKAGRRKDRDNARMEKFKQVLSETENTAVSLGFKLETIKDFSPHMKKNKLDHYINKRKDKLNSKTEIKKIQFVKASSEEVIQEPIQPVVIKPSLFGSCREKTEVTTPIAEIPSKKILEMSAESEDKRFIKSRISAIDYYPVVRRYVSHLHSCGYGFINSFAESKLSVESLFMREGIPTGDKLVKLYYEVMRDRGFSDDAIEEDLNGLKAYEQTSRIIRLQTAREKTRAWYGLKGGGLCQIEPVDYDYYNLEHKQIRVNCSIGVSATISDASGVLNRFN